MCSNNGFPPKYSMYPTAREFLLMVGNFLTPWATPSHDKRWNASVEESDQGATTQNRTNG